MGKKSKQKKAQPQKQPAKNINLKKMDVDAIARGIPTGCPDLNTPAAKAIHAAGHIADVYREHIADTSVEHLAAKSKNLNQIRAVDLIEPDGLEEVYRSAVQFLHDLFGKLDERHAKKSPYLNAPVSSARHHLIKMEENMDHYFKAHHNN